MLLMVHPQGMSADLQDAVFKFSTAGGKVLAFFDIMPESLELFDTSNISFTSSDYGDLPQRWGFHFYDDLVVTDLANSTQVAVETVDYAGNTQDLIQFFVTNNEMAQDLPEVAQLKRILMTSASIFMPLKEYIRQRLFENLRPMVNQSFWRRILSAKIPRIHLISSWLVIRICFMIHFGPQMCVLARIGIMYRCWIVPILY